MNETLTTKLEKIFSVDFFCDEFDPQGDEYDLAEIILKEYKWNDIYTWFYNHLVTSCLTDKEVYNAINLYFNYQFDKQIVPNPYELCGYILYRIDIENDYDEYGEFVDDFIIDVLENAGKINLTESPYYQSWNDPILLEAKEKWKTIKTI